MNLFFSECFLSFEIDCFFGNRQQSNARSAEKNMFFGNALPKSNARDHLKQKKKQWPKIKNNRCRESHLCFFMFVFHVSLSIDIK